MPRYVVGPHRPEIPFSSRAHALEADQLARLSRFASCAPLTWAQSAAVWGVREPQSPAFWARLIGDTSPYSWVQQWVEPGGFWRDGTLSGTNNAFEVNGVVGLDQRRVWLKPGGPADYRFQWIHLHLGEGAGREPSHPCGVPKTDLELRLEYRNDDQVVSEVMVRIRYAPDGVWESGEIEIGDYHNSGSDWHRFVLEVTPNWMILHHFRGPSPSSEDADSLAEYSAVLNHQCDPFQLEIDTSSGFDQDVKAIIRVWG